MDRLAPPGATGLYHPAHEQDACGVALVAKLDGYADHAVVERALVALENLEHRGAEGADPSTGDGAGILLGLPDEFMRAVAPAALPAPGSYAVGTLFLPPDPDRRDVVERRVEEVVHGEGQRVLGWRDVPVDTDHVGSIARRTMPYIRQLFVAAADDMPSGLPFERRLFLIRRALEKELGAELAIATLSARTIAYKGMLTAPQLPNCFPDLRDERLATRVALVHSRFSTNTFPSWPLAHPYRLICHNGEINTLRGNVNWMRARESQLASEAFGDDLKRAMPLVTHGASDSGTFDSVLELLTLSGRELPHALMMMMPQAYEKDEVPDEVRGFYDYHACLMEPWDGPAAVAFSDGRWAGAMLDRNGLRPGRWQQTRDGYVVMASETGVLPAAPGDILRKGRLHPGRLFLVDLEEGRIVEDDEIKLRVATQKPYGEWFQRNTVVLDELPEHEPTAPRIEPLRAKQLAFGYTQEDLRLIIAPMATRGEEPVASMGNDAALAVLSDRQPPLFSYFKQLFAQVTNPPIDSIRENVVMSLTTGVGGEGNLLEETPEHAHQLILQQPILRNKHLEKLRGVSHEVFSSRTLDTTWKAEEGPEGMERRLDLLCSEAEKSVAAGANILILSDRNLGKDRAPIPSLLALAAVHQHLVRCGTRLRCGLVVESGEPREIHHMATLIGYGASAINPYLMFESLDEMTERHMLPLDLDRQEAERLIVKAIGK
ncbi:MAG TPA: glutamate synthase central domain-containing protein, partial [Solirubrobacteraceae bacterium]